MLRIVLYRFSTVCFGVNWGSCHWNITGNENMPYWSYKSKGTMDKYEVPRKAKSTFLYWKRQPSWTFVRSQFKIGFAQWYYIMKDLLTYYITFGVWDKRMIDWLIDWLNFVLRPIQEYFTQIVTPWQILYTSFSPEPMGPGIIPSFKAHQSWKVKQAFLIACRPSFVHLSVVLIFSPRTTGTISTKLSTRHLFYF